MMKTGTLCYVRKDGKTLMIHRNKREDDFHYGKYVAPGGKNEPGESDEDCAAREVLEEAGIKIKQLVPKGTVIFRNKNRIFSNNITEEDYRVAVFIAGEFEGEPKKECREGTLEWIADEELTDLPMWEGDKLFTGWLNQPKYFNAELFYEDKKLADHTVIFQ